jgi:hypothetical protein
LENKVKRESIPHWEHKVFRIVNNRMLNDDIPLEIPARNLDFMFLDDFDNESEELFFSGWRHHIGFVVDKNRMYLIYKRPKSELSE